MLIYVWLLLEEIPLSLRELSLEIWVGLLLGTRRRQKILLASSVEVSLVYGVESSFIKGRINGITSRGCIAGISGFSLKHVGPLVDESRRLLSLWLVGQRTLMQVCSLFVVDVSQGISLVDAFGSSRRIASICQR